MTLLPETRYYLILLVCILTISGCGHLHSNKKLPILGRKDIKETEINGKITYDTIYHKIADFSFVDQDSNKVARCGTMSSNVSMPPGTQGSNIPVNELNR